MRLLALIAFVAGCRFSWSPHMGVAARRSNVTTYALFAKDDTAKGLAREVLARDPHIQLVEGDAPDSEQCGWAAAHGAEMYTVAYADVGYDSRFKCTKAIGGIFSKHEECVDGYETDKHTSASYTLTTYDAATCKEIPRLTAKFSARAPGEEEQSKPEALAMLAERVRMKSDALPDQATIDAEGRLVGDAPNGFYALYRNGKYRGYVRREGEYLTPMYWPMDLEPGDTLVERGQRKFLELAFDFVAFRINGRSAFGPGMHLRHYSLDGGFQFGLDADQLFVSSDSERFLLVTAEIGWGLPIAPGFVFSANLGAGGVFAAGRQDSGSAPVLLPMLRLQTFLTTWWFVSVDAGIAVLTDLRAPISRITVGFDL